MSILKIYQPKIQGFKNSVKLMAEFEVNGKKDVLWYEVDKKYQDYLTIERSDAFFVGLLLFGLKNGYDIHVLAPMSEKLYYTVKKYLAPLIIFINGYKNINILCEHLVSAQLPNEEKVGTGLSCGIDSFSTIIDHIGDQSLRKFEIDYFTFFNVGSNGSFGGDGARKLFKKRGIIAEKCSEDLGKELISVDSNLSEILSINFAQTHTIRNISALLILQKLFKVYYYSSAVHIKDFTLSKDPAYYDIFNLSMLSTESLSLYSSNAVKTRVEKTKMVASFKPAQKYLNVCVKEDLNCGKCFKCLRTLLTLEIIGELQSFKPIFNLENYYNNRLKYLSHVIANRDTDVLSKEIYDEIISSKYKIPLYSKVRVFLLKIKKNIKCLIC